MKRPRNVVPFYVGKTWKGYVNEVFKPFQVDKYNNIVHKHGTPVLFLIYKSAKKEK
jgi:hypothetical protein